MPNGVRTGLPPGTFPQIAGNWMAGDAVTIQFDSPKQFLRRLAGLAFAFRSVERIRWVTSAEPSEMTRPRYRSL